MKITKITTQQKNSSRYSIFIDDKYSFSLSDIALLEAKLAIGQELTKEQVKDLEEKSELDKLYQRVLNLLYLRARSQYEIVTYLKKHQCPAPMIEIIVNKLSNAGLVNDLSYAKSWIENRQLLRPSSKLKLITELRAKGIDKETIAGAFDSVDMNESTALLSVIEKKRKLTRFKDDEKLMQYLIRQGFRYSDIKDAFRA